LEENDAEVKKLKSWLSRIQTRDFFSASLGPKAVAAFAAAVKDFSRYEPKLRVGKSGPKNAGKKRRIARIGRGESENRAAGMGWLFAMALGLQERQRSAVWRALPRIAVVGVIVALVAVIHATIPYQETSSDCGGSAHWLRRLLACSAISSPTNILFS
jgi:hypothetical protein